MHGTMQDALYLLIFKILKKTNGRMFEEDFIISLLRAQATKYIVWEECDLNESQNQLL